MANCFDLRIIFGLNYKKKKKKARKFVIPS